jgi:hypothetical protein
MPNPPVPTLYHYGVLAGYIIVAIIMPLILSLILTSFQAKQLIVPPFYITLISSVWMLVLLVNVSNISTQLVPVLTIGMFYSTLGWGEDWIATSILGKATERESIYFEQLRVYADFNFVKARLTIPEIRRALHISERTEGNIEEGLLFKSISTVFKNDIIIARDTEYPELTCIKIVYYEVGKYSLKVSPFFIEAAHKMSGYIKDVFNNHVPIIAVEVIVPFTNKALDQSIDRVIDNLRGYYVRSKQLSTADRLKIALLAGTLVLTGILFLIEQPTYAVLSIAIEVLIAVLGLPDIIRKQKE